MIDMYKLILPKNIFTNNINTFLILSHKMSENISPEPVVKKREVERRNQN